MVSARQSVETDEISTKLFHDELDRILESSEFSSIPRRRKLLKFLVEETLAGRDDQLKGYTIGIAVFGRSEGFDPNADPVVRIEAHRLRRDLDGYYMGTGRDDPLRITIPKGRYVPKIVSREDVPSLPPDIRESDREPAPRSWIDRLSGYRLTVGFGLLVACLGAFVAYRGLGEDTWFEPDAVKKAPGIAVRFSPLSDQSPDIYLANGFSSQVENQLNRYPDIRLFAINRSGQQDLVETARQLGVSFLVIGDISTTGNGIRVHARLIDTQSAHIVWSEAYDREMQPHAILEAQDEIAEAVASTLGQSFGIIRTELVNRMTSGFDPSMVSFECVLYATEYRRTLDREMHSEALACLESTVGQEPRYAEAWALLAYAYFFGAVFDHVDPSVVDPTFASAVEAANRALLLDEDNTTALKALSVTSHYLGNFEESERFARLAIAKHPQDPEALVQLGWRLAIRGRFADGIPLLEQGISRTVNPPGWYYHLIAVDRLVKNDGEGMLVAAQHSLKHGNARSYSLLAMAHGLLGNRKAAQQALNRMSKIQPDYDPVESWRKHQATEEIVAAIARVIDGIGEPEGVDAT